LKLFNNHSILLEMEEDIYKDMPALLPVEPQYEPSDNQLTFEDLPAVVQTSMINTVITDQFVALTTMTPEKDTAVVLAMTKILDRN
jgi:hypothetical protein